MSKCSRLSWLPGRNATVNETSITVNQEKYNENLLKKFGMSGCKALSSLMVEHVELTKDTCLEGGEEQRVISERNYRAFIGSVIYFSLSSRPDKGQAWHVLGFFFGKSR